MTPLRPVLFAALVALFALGGAACQQKSSSDKAPAVPPPVTAAEAAAAKDQEPKQPKDRPAIEGVKPSIDLKTPPVDAIKLPSGILYKKLVSVTEGTPPTRNDTVVIHFTGWKVASGDTFNTTRTRGTPMPLDLSTAGVGFSDVFTQLRKGEKVMIWMPAELVGKGGQGVPEALAFEAELVDIQPAPPVPADVAGPPASALKTRGGLRYVVVEPGSGDKARFFDTAAFRYTIWDATGKMLSSTEKRSRPVSSALYRQPAPLEDIMTGMAAGQRVRFWVDAAKMEQISLEQTQGQLCYELQLTELTRAKTAPPPTPKDVKAPPPGVKKTESGVFYRVLKAAPPLKAGATPLPASKPKASDNVKVHYTGWTTDGRMFDSSVVRGEPASFPLTGVVQGWTDGVPMMNVGETVRFWIPEALAYKGMPNNPKGMLVFDIELLEILPPAPPSSPHGGHGGMGGPGGMGDSHSDDDGHGH
jgi:FKBP-type peptidyl-prolyl cis-trans isomerase